MKPILEMKAARALSAYAVLRDGVHVATIQFFFGDTGRVQCDVYAPFCGLVHRGVARGSGYDKNTAAIAGAIIGGVVLDNKGSTAGGYEIVDDGFRWDIQLLSNGFDLVQAL